MVLLLIALLAASEAPPPVVPEVLGRANWVFSTIGHSEWCPAGNVRLDLQTGRYVLTVRAPPPACNRADLERQVKTGTLAADRLAQLRAVSQKVVAVGMRKPGCDGHKIEDIVISNGGTPLLVLTTGSGASWTSAELGCWTEAATTLQRGLDQTFVTRDRR